MTESTVQKRLLVQKETERANENQSRILRDATLPDYLTAE